MLENTFLIPQGSLLTFPRESTIEKFHRISLVGVR